ncbi:MAG: hypothetical protein H6700_12350 [Myxococcales bacterium]|nr:hypothetical protein [Myxococcales bacterium]
MRRCVVQLAESCDSAIDTVVSAANDGPSQASWRLRPRSAALSCGSALTSALWRRGRRHRQGDDGNNADGDGCDGGCRSELWWRWCTPGGGGLRRSVTGGATCADSPASTAGELVVCGLRPRYFAGCRDARCGDGFVDGAEECDDATQAGDGCSATHTNAAGDVVQLLLGERCEAETCAGRRAPPWFAGGRFDRAAGCT